MLFGAGHYARITTAALSAYRAAWAQHGRPVYEQHGWHLGTADFETFAVSRYPAPYSVVIDDFIRLRDYDTWLFAVGWQAKQAGVDFSQIPSIEYHAWESASPIAVELDYALIALFKQLALDAVHFRLSKL